MLIHLTLPSWGCLCSACGSLGCSSPSMSTVQLGFHCTSLEAFWVPRKWRNSRRGFRVACSSASPTGNWVFSFFVFSVISCKVYFLCRFEVLDWIITMHELNGLGLNLEVMLRFGDKKCEKWILNDGWIGSFEMYREGQCTLHSRECYRSTAWTRFCCHYVGSYFSFVVLSRLGLITTDLYPCLEV